MEPTKPIKSERVYRFVEEYAKDRNGLQAAIRAGYSEKTAGAQACTLLKDPKVQELIAVQCNRASEVALMEAADVLRQWVLVATADPTKISRVRHTNCRHCWGVDHEYQWGAREYAEQVESNARLGLPMPPCVGGFGWAHNRPPNPACPDCKGEGHTETYFEDMDKLGPAERRLIAAVKKTKDGIEVKMRDQDGAVAHIAKYLGMLVEKRELSGPNGGPVVVADIPAELAGDTKALAALYAKLAG